MEPNEIALRMALRWRKVYGFRNRTKLQLDDRLNAMATLREFLKKERSKPKLIIPGRLTL